MFFSRVNITNAPFPAWSVLECYNNIFLFIDIHIHILRDYLLLLNIIWFTLKSKISYKVYCCNNASIQRNLHTSMNIEQLFEGIFPYWFSIVLTYTSQLYFF